MKNFFELFFYKSVNSTNDKLKELKQLPKTSNASIKNALFVGSTAELQKMLNRKKEDESIKSKNITPEKTDISD